MDYHCFIRWLKCDTNNVIIIQYTHNECLIAFGMVQAFNEFWNVYAQSSLVVTIIIIALESIESIRIERQ